MLEWIVISSVVLIDSLEPLADERPQLDVHLSVGRVVGQIDGLDGSVQELFWGQHLAVLVQPVRLAQDQAGVDRLKILLHFFATCLGGGGARKD